MSNTIIETNEIYPAAPRLFKNPDRFPEVGHNILGNTPDRIDSFFVEKEDKFKLHLGFDIGDSLSLLRYELNGNGNIDRFRFGFDGNMVLLGQVTESQVGFNVRPEQLEPADTEAIMIGLRIRMDNENFETYQIDVNDMVRFHDLKTGMDDQYFMRTNEFVNKMEEDKIIPVNLLTPFILKRIAEQYAYCSDARVGNQKKQNDVLKRQENYEHLPVNRNS